MLSIANAQCTFSNSSYGNGSAPTQIDETLVTYTCSFFSNYSTVTDFLSSTIYTLDIDHLDTLPFSIHLMLLLNGETALYPSLHQLMDHTNFNGMVLDAHPTITVMKQLLLMQAYQLLVQILH
jgi:regulatory protein YycH of two-component signal transduction system YycFG